MTLLRDLIRIPESVEEGDFVVRAAEAADLGSYVVTDQLKDSFADALKMVEHALATGRSQAKFLHGSFGSGKSHFMAVLREILHHNRQVRAVPGLDEVAADTDRWLPGKKLLTLTYHMLDAQSVEQAVLEGYLNQVTAAHPEAPTPAVHRSDALLAGAARIRARMGDADFFAALGEAGTEPGSGGGGLAAHMARAAGWTAETYAKAAASHPGTPERDGLVTALTATFFMDAVRGGEYLDLDTGLAVITRHAKALGYDAMVLFLDELILWLSTKITDHTFVNAEGAKLNKLVESADAARPLPIVSFVARQRNLEEFLGPQVGGTEREALAHLMRSVQGRLGDLGQVRVRDRRASAAQASERGGSTYHRRGLRGGAGEARGLGRAAAGHAVRRCRHRIRCDRVPPPVPVLAGTRRRARGAVAGAPAGAHRVADHDGAARQPAPHPRGERPHRRVGTGRSHGSEWRSSGPAEAEAAVPGGSGHLPQQAAPALVGAQRHHRGAGGRARAVQLGRSSGQDPPHRSVGA